MQEISVADLADSRAEWTVLDVRNPDEFSAGHVPGAVLMPLSVIPVRISELTRSTRYAVICQAGGRSAQACSYLSAQGFDVTNVNGGTEAWISASFPVNKGMDE